MAALYTALPRDHIEEIGRTDFARAFPWAMIERLEEFNWRLSVPEQEFLDSELEAMRLDLSNTIKKFIILAIRNTAYVDPRADRELRRVPDQYKQKGKYAEEINSAADRVYKAYL
ncbi:MAG: hypothetical protein ABI383_08370, partial [Acidobacteriaceae bacterium]